MAGWRRIVPYGFLAPFLLVFLAFKVLPLLYALDLSFYREALVGGVRFVGLQNYERVAEDAKFWLSVRNMAVFGLVQVPFMLGTALALALLLDSGLARAANAFRLAFYLPYAVPSVIATLIWGYLYGPTFGPFAQGMRWLSLPAPQFLSADWIHLSLANVVTWEYVGYNMIIMYSALQAVPRELEEAATIDGAGKLAYALRVKVPMIRSAIMVTVIFSIIGIFQLFNEPKLMKALAPDVIGDHFTPNLYAYSMAFVNQEYNYTAALSFVIGAVVAIVSYCFMFLGRDPAAKESRA